MLKLKSIQKEFVKAHKELYQMKSDSSFCISTDILEKPWKIVRWKCFANKGTWTCHWSGKIKNKKLDNQSAKSKGNNDENS